MKRPKLLDLFCGAGGAAMGYYKAGFDVFGVDIVAQPNYPFDFHQDDALSFLKRRLDDFDVIHASPPCQHYSVASKSHNGNRQKHPDFIPDVSGFPPSKRWYFSFPVILTDIGFTAFVSLFLVYHRRDISRPKTIIDINSRNTRRTTVKHG